MNSNRMEWDRDFIVASFGYGSERGCLILGACESHEFFFSSVKFAAEKNSRVRFTFLGRFVSKGHVSTRGNLIFHLWSGSRWL